MVDTERGGQYNKFHKMEIQMGRVGALKHEKVVKGFESCIA